jgi:hypothetical protein
VGVVHAVPGGHELVVVAAEPFAGAVVGAGAFFRAPNCTVNHHSAEILALPFLGTNVGAALMAFAIAGGTVHCPLCVTAVYDAQAVRLAERREVSHAFSWPRDKVLLATRGRVAHERLRDGNGHCVPRAKSRRRSVLAPVAK